MREYSFHAKSTNDLAKRLSVTLFVAAFLLLAVIFVFSVPYAGFIEGICVVLLTFAVLLLTRFVYKSFIYRVVMRDDGRFDLTVTERYGKGETTVCRVALSGIERIEKLTDKNKKELRAAAKGRKSFSYCPDILSKDEYWVFVTECSEELLIKLAPDEELLAILLYAEKETT